MYVVQYMYMYILLYFRDVIILFSFRSRFSKMFGNILEREFDRSNSEVLGVALYIEGLLKLLQFRVKDMKSGPKALPLFIPAGLRSKIFSTFTDERYINE